MELFNTGRMILGFILFAGLGINFFYQAFQAFRRLRRIQYSEETVHKFRCQQCEDIYEMSGQDLQARTTLWSTRKEIKTPRSQSTSIRFECPMCQQKAFQEKIFDTNVTAGLGNFRAQYDENTKGIIIDLLVKAFLPFLIGMPILSFLL
jgi:hypothetical protein